MLREGSAGAGNSRYEVLGPLGQGGFGSVYEARDTRTGLLVALKELRDSSGESIARFKQEFRALSGCHHPNLVGLKELIEQDGRWLIVMELVNGTDFLEYVSRTANDNAFSFDEARLRGALSGMVEGLSALHGYGVLHRDLKPSNVRVTPEGRSVLLDFGLATSIHATEQSTHAMALGTVAYMAPEQASGKRLGPEADLYALGVCLFEGLTGQVPFDGTSAVDILLRKQTEPAPRASSVARGVPGDLDELCARLLTIDPAARPSAAEVRGLLGGKQPDVPIAVSLTPGPQIEETFAGREVELQKLQHAFAKTHEGLLRIVLVEGESGVGKSELVAEFLRRARAKEPRLLTLYGRCYENEQVSYKAFDGCIDELARALRRMPKDECEALLPVRSALLAQLFPVLREVKPISQAPREGISADPTARRLEAFAALAALLANLAADRPAILVVDDLQWADAESFRLLTALVEAPEPPPVLLLATVRPRGELEQDVLSSVLSMRQWPETSVVELLGLPPQEARALARKLLGREVPEDWLDMLARESEGHPLLLAELVQFAATRDRGQRGVLTIEQALSARIERLAGSERELLEVVALAGRPYGSHVFAHALSVESVDVAARSLLAAKLLRLRKGQELSSYHDRIRHAAVAFIARARLAPLHRRLAEALASAPDSDPSEQARHWDLGGETQRAIDAYERAAAKVLESLAFARAEQLCARAMELIEDPVDERLQRLTVRRAHALACAGRNGEAAVLYQQAADRAHGEGRVQLRSRVAQQLMLSSKIGPGLAAANELLRELGFRLPRRPLGAILRFAWDGACLLLQRLWRFVPRRARDEDLPLDIATQMMYVLGTVDPLTYIVLMMQSVRRAAHAASPLNKARALAWHAWVRGLQGTNAAVLALVEAARKIVDEHGDPVARAGVAFAEGSAYISAFDWKEAAVHFERAQRILQEECPDRSWLLMTVRYHLSSTWYNLGENARADATIERWLAEARERKDHLSTALLCGMGYGFLRHLAADAPEAAIAELSEATAPIAAEPYSFPHLGKLIGTLLSLTYRGGPEALRLLDEEERTHGAAFLLRAGTIRRGLAILRGMAALSAVASATGADRARFVREAERAMHKVRRDRSPFARGIVELGDAQLAFLADERADAITHARAARTTFDGLQHAYRRAARYLEGVLEGGEPGEERCRLALEELAAEGFRQPRRWVRMLVPLLDELTASGAPARASSNVSLIGRYEVIGQVAGGGFGTVVSARDTRSGRTVALKELTQRGGASLERFKREFRTLQQVHHENLVHIEALFEHEGVWYIVMELVEGDDLLSYVRPAGRCDQQRLIDAFVGLVDALSALHDAGYVHRNLTPANVRVTGEGRAVLLDFGLVARLGEVGESAPAASDYAAPELLEGAPAHPSADVYALGACLSRALAGPAARDGAASRGRAAAQLAAPQPPESPELRELAGCCARMLSPVAAARPSLRELRELLLASGVGASREAVAASESARDDVPFSGREAELAVLDEAFERTCDDGMLVVLVEGESGLGKSALVSEFARRVAERSPRVRVLASRCYENEQVAFKAFDGAVDELARLLRGLSNPLCEALLPKRAALLGQLFPVLTSVPAIEHASKKGLPADPTARQLAARACFTELLLNLGTQLELLFVVDDLQWADSESFRLLATLLESKRELPFLFVGTIRPAAELDDARTARALEELRARAETSVLLLSGLSEPDAAALTGELFGGPLEDEQRARIVRESKGHPLFLRELVEQERRGHAGPSAPTLDDALRARIESFEPEARELIALAAMAGKPLPIHVFARALELRTLPWSMVAGLLANGMLTRRGDEDLACFHDRIRRVALDTLSREGRSRLAERLARALEPEPRVEAADLAQLWEEAEQAEKAIDAYERAGDRALGTLAFARAEQHYARALELAGEEHDERRRRLLVQRGHALVRSGRSAEAAHAFQAASRGAQGEQKVRLRIWAAQQMLQSAQIDEGLEAASTLLRELGEHTPTSDRAALLRIAWERACIRVRGIELTGRRALPSSREKLALEALRGLAQPVTAVAPLSGLTLTLRYLRRALDAGEPELTARALALGAMWRVVTAPDDDQTAVFERSRALAEASGDPELRAHVETYWGLACMQSQVRAAPSHLTIAHELLQSRCPGERWSLTLTRMYLGCAWLYAGDYAALARHLGGWVDEARARADSYAFAALSGVGGGALRHLMAGRPEDGLAELDDAMAPWPAVRFSSLHLGAFCLRSMLRSASRDPEMIGWLDREDAALRRPFLMRAPTSRFLLHLSRFAGHLSVLESASSPEAPGRLASARHEARAMARIDSRHSTAASLYATAILHAAEGDAERALEDVRAARARLRTAGTFLERGAAYLEGWLEGGEGGRSAREAVLGALQTEGFRDPRAGLQLLLPGAHLFT